jgi:hypothetical protein
VSTKQSKLARAHCRLSTEPASMRMLTCEVEWLAAKAARGRERLIKGLRKPRASFCSMQEPRVVRQPMSATSSRAYFRRCLAIGAQATCLRLSCVCVAAASTPADLIRFGPILEQCTQGFARRRGCPRCGAGGGCALSLYWPTSIAARSQSPVIAAIDADQFHIRLGNSSEHRYRLRTPIKTRDDGLRCHHSRRGCVGTGRPALG